MTEKCQTCVEEEARAIRRGALTQARELIRTKAKKEEAQAAVLAAGGLTRAAENIREIVFGLNKACGIIGQLMERVA